jgi:hypothetical protein
MPRWLLKLSGFGRGHTSPVRLLLQYPHDVWIMRSVQAIMQVSQARYA